MKGDSLHYISADPLVSGCLYVGAQQVFNQYKLHQQQRKFADEDQMECPDVVGRSRVARTTGGAAAINNRAATKEEASRERVQDVSGWTRWMQASESHLQ